MSENVNRPSCGPRRRWSRARASSRRVQVRLQVGLRVEGRPVDAREHRAVGVAAPVRAGRGEQLERLDALRRRRVRAAAEVGERAVGVERDRVDPVVPDEVLDQLDLVVLVLALEALERLLGRDVLTLEVLVGRDVLGHPGLDGREVGVGDRDAVRELEVVVEAVVDRRADGDLHAGIEVHHRGGEHVRRVVADQRQRVRRAVGDDLHLRLVGQRAGEVAQLAVDLDGQGRTGETGSTAECTAHPASDRPAPAGSTAASASPGRTPPPPRPCWHIRTESPPPTAAANCVLPTSRTIRCLPSGESHTAPPDSTPIAAATIHRRPNTRTAELRRGAVSTTIVSVGDCEPTITAPVLAS